MTGDFLKCILSSEEHSIGWFIVNLVHQELVRCLDALVLLENNVVFICLYVGLALLLFAMTLSSLFHLRFVHRLPPSRAPSLEAESDDHSPEGVQCSIIVAARDEEERIADTIGHLRSQVGVNFEIVVVDDRSTDRTPQILAEIALSDDRLRVIRVDELPTGWLGKCHACHIGANSATGEWLLFTDGDCWLRPDVVARAMSVAQAEKVDHIALTPGIKGESVGTQAWHLAFLISLANWFSGVNRDHPKAYLGMGAFNLVRASAYRTSGGYAALRLTILDDVRLGLLLRRAGFHTRAFIGGDDVECHWGHSILDMIKIMEKNYFAALDFKVSFALAIGIVGTTIWTFAILGPFTLTVVGILAGLALMSLSIPAAVLARRLSWTMTSSLVTPFVYFFLFYAILRSAWITTGQGGVRWRDTFYPLKDLREGAVR